MFLQDYIILLKINLGVGVLLFKQKASLPDNPDMGNKNRLSHVVISVPADHVSAILTSFCLQ